MSFSGPVPINTTVEIRARGHEGKVGRVSGYELDDTTGETVNRVSVPHDKGVDHLLVRGEDLDPVKFNADLWKKHCWTPPKGGA